MRDASSASRMVQAAAITLSRMVPRPVSDLRDMLAVEVEAIKGRKSIDRASALEEAKVTILKAIKSGQR